MDNIIIQRGTVFRTQDRFGNEIESGCIALSAPSSHGGFLALDSDLVECHFHIAMVKETYGEVADGDIDEILGHRR